MTDEERIVVDGEFNDGISRPAETAAHSVENLGEEAAKTSLELEEMGHAANAAERDLKGLDAETQKAELRLKRQQAQLRRTQLELKGLAAEAAGAGDETHKMGDEAEVADKKLQKLARTIGGAGSGGSGGGGNTLWGRMKGFFNFAKKFGFIFRWAFMGIKFTAIATGISFLARGVAGLGAAAYGAVAGLAPLTGMLVAYPGILAAGVQAMGVFKLATSGMGNLISVLGNPDATADQIMKATQNMSQSQILFARAIVDSKKAWMGLKSNVNAKFYSGLVKDYKALTKTYLPIFNKQLGREAVMLNGLVKSMSKYMESAKGQDTIGDIMANNVTVGEHMGKAFGYILLTILNLVHAGGPMLRELSRDIESVTGSLADATDANQGKLRKFFLGSYNLFKQVIEVSGYYIHGLWNIGKQATGMSEFLGHGVTKIGKNFEAWTESHRGKKDINGFFKDMIPVVKEITKWIGALGGALGELTMGQGDFLKTSRYLRTVTLPMLVGFINSILEQVIPTVEKAGHIYQNLKASGFIGGMTHALSLIGQMTEKFSEMAASLPDPVKKGIGWATTLTSLVGILNGISGKSDFGNKIINSASFGMLGKEDVQHVFVDNWAMIAAGSAAGGGAGAAEGAGAGAAAGWMSKAAGGLKKLAIPLVVTVGAVKGSNWVMDKIMGKPTVDATAANPAVAALAQGQDPKMGSFDQVGDVMREINSSFSHAEHNALGWVPFGGTAWGDAQETINNLDQSLANMVKGGNLTGAKAAMDQIVKSAQAQGISMQETVKWFDKYDAALEAVRTAPTKDIGDWTDRYANQLKRVDKLLWNINDDQERADRKSRGNKAPYMTRVDHGAVADTVNPLANVSRGSTQYTAGLTKSINLIVDRFEHLRKSGAMTGAEIKRIFGKDIVNTLRSLPPSVAVAMSTPGAFDSIKDVERLDKQFHLLPEQKVTLLKLLGTDAAEAAAARLQAKIDGLHDKQVNIEANVTANLSGAARNLIAHGMDINGLYTGGATEAGRQYLVGELGPEAWISKSGVMRMLGTRGPEVVTPGEGAVIPASATSDPYGGSMGLTPAWAQDAFRRAADAHLGSPSSIPVPRDSGGSDMPPIQMQVGPIYASENVDVEASIKKAWADIEREKKERS